MEGTDKVVKDGDSNKFLRSFTLRILHILTEHMGLSMFSAMVLINMLVCSGTIYKVAPFRANNFARK
jgi:hypothetical protein